MKRMNYQVQSFMGEQRFSFLSLVSIENDVVKSLTVACREGGGQDDGPGHPRQWGASKK